jgi:hypothetical protein
MFGKHSLTVAFLSAKGHLRSTYDVAYDNVLKTFDNVWCAKGLIAIRNNLVVSWKNSPKKILHNFFLF